MKSAIGLPVALLLSIGVCPASAAVEEAAQERSPSVSPDGTNIACRRAIERSTSLNGGQLFEAAEACAEGGEADDAVFLMLAGQVRALTDMSLLTPDSEGDEAAAGQLYGTLFYKYGGPGPDELFRDADRTTAMLARLRNWRPVFSESYTPGWGYKGPVASERYELMVDHSIRSRLAELRSYGNLLENDRYYAIHRERHELLARNNYQITQGTDDANRIAELQQLLDSISDSIARVPEPLLPQELQPDYAPNPNAEFEQLHAGFNGIEGPGLVIFDSRTDALGSWLSRAVSADDLETLLNQVDFAREHLVVLLFVPTVTATGKLYIRDIAYRSGQRNISVSGVMGVNEEGCEELKALSHPFVIASTPRPSFEVESQSSDFATVPDGCRLSVGAD